MNKVENGEERISRCNGSLYFPISHQEGGFFSAEDADSLPTASSKEKKEGAFCVWKREEVYKLLPQAVPDKEGVTYADVFVHHYGVEKEGNVDPFKVRGGWGI